MTLIVFETWKTGQDHQNWYERVNLNGGDHHAKFQTSFLKRGKNPMLRFLSQLAAHWKRIHYFP